MSEILFHYHKVNPTTWVYLSSLLMIGLFFQFNRFWSVRNLDLVLLILLAPGLLMVNQAREVAADEPAATADIAPTNEEPATDATAAADPMASQPTSAVGGHHVPSARRRMAYNGYLWLFSVSLAWLVRMLIDPTMIRRPLLEPNATKGCLLFLGCSLFIFLMANVMTSDPSLDDLRAAEG